jgi:hypothetical protein
MKKEKTSAEVKCYFFLKKSKKLLFFKKKSHNFNVKKYIKHKLQGFLVWN